MKLIIAMLKALWFVTMCVSAFISFAGGMYIVYNAENFEMTIDMIKEKLSYKIVFVSVIVFILCTFIGLTVLFF